jgi:hypothetical protein
MSSGTTSAQLDEVRAAITKVLTGGQRIKQPDGTEIELASLAELRSREQELLALIEQESGSGNYRVVARRSLGGGGA